MKRISLLRPNSIVMMVSIIMLFGIFFIKDTSSLSYQNSVDLSFTFNPTISVNVSGDLVIDNLSPGNASDSNIITVTTASNSIAGYDLKATVGSSTNAYTDLRLSSSDTTNKFTALSSNKATLNAFDNDTWGYSYSTDSGTTWVSGNVGSTTTGYNGLPQYNNTGTLLINTTTPTSSSIQFKIGAKASNTKVSGDYTNTINFIATSKVLTTHYSLTYNKNTNEEVLGMPSNISDTYTIDSSITLSSATPERAGYNFTGWCSVDNSADPTTCSGTIYQPGGTVSLTVGQGNTITLYAVWEAVATGMDCSEANSYIYCKVLDEWVAGGSRVQTNDTDTSTGIQADITTANSGVFKYNSEVFGEDSDATKADGTKDDIYYFRGILDQTTGSYGSDGDGVAWPNYVILQSGSSKTTNDTCWRIVRTTASDGVKMIYNGTWTGSTCANATTNAQVTDSAFNGTSSTYQQIVRVGYTYNSTYATNTAQSGTIAQVFGTNSTSSVNDTRSDIKAYIEDTWYASNMTAYTSILEPSAGYCNDRTMNTTTSWTAPLSEDSIIAATYGASSLQAYYFGAYPRNMNTTQPPSLTCGNKYSQIDRSVVDLYRYVANSDGLSNELKYPVALLTADEVSFAGSGKSTASQGSSYHANSFLRSGSYFWLLSPFYRHSSGDAYGFRLGSSGSLSSTSVYVTTLGVRPAISLASGTTATSGSGTATDPWVVTAP